MIQAVLGGKSLGYEFTEDILTSTVFGTIKYIRPDAILIPFIESAFLYDKNRTYLWEILSQEGIELRCYRKVEYVFWAWNPNYGEPDLLVIFSDHIHGKDDFLLIIEAKFKSGKSGVNENDQLARYYEAVSKDIENFSEPIVSSFKGIKGYIVYLTEHEAVGDISDSIRIIQERNNNTGNKVFHLRWHMLYKTLEKMNSIFSSYEKVIVKDLMEYLEKLGLRDFSGISLPDDALANAFAIPFPVFYREDQKDKKTYFDLVNERDLKFQKFVFYGGNVNE